MSMMSEGKEGFIRGGYSHYFPECDDDTLFDLIKSIDLTKTNEFVFEDKTYTLWLDHHYIYINGVRSHCGIRRIYISGSETSSYGRKKEVYRYGVGISKKLNRDIRNLLYLRALKRDTKKC